MELVPLAAILAAADRIKGIPLRTPLLPYPELSDHSGGGEMLVKCENLQPTGSFKVRGAGNFVLGLSNHDAARGVITYSSGNHGQAVAFAAQARGTRAVVVMPVTAPEIKIGGVKRLGAEVVMEGRTSLERKERAEAIAAAEGLVVVPPFDHEAIIAGQGTVGLEIVQACPDVGTVVVPIGGGGLVSGVAAAVKRLKPTTVVVGVEPRGAASMTRALSHGGPVSLGSPDTIADGLAPVQVGELNFRHVRELVDEVVTVSDSAIQEAAWRLLLERRLVVEHSGAATTALILEGARNLPAPTVLVVSGGNLAALPTLVQTLGGPPSHETGAHLGSSTSAPG